MIMAGAEQVAQSKDQTDYLAIQSIRFADANVFVRRSQCRRYERIYGQKIKKHRK